LKLYSFKIICASRSNVKKYEMFAIVEIAGQQFKVEEGDKIFVHRLEVESGEKVEFDQVLLIEDEGKLIIGEPAIKDALVEGKVLDHLRGDKVIIFKKKRKKGYRIRNGHRQNFTQVEIVSIKEKAVKKGTKKEGVVSVEPVTEKPVIIETKVPEKKPAVKKAATAKSKERNTPVKKTATIKTVSQKPVAKKTAAKKPAKGKA
jgi:large subunit ribosomal protein L21